MNSEPFISFHKPYIGDAEINEVVDTLRSGWLTTGPRTAKFESEFKTYVGARHALAVNSCTAGLHLALAALNIGPGDEVITTPLTFCSTVNTILHVGATPVLADIADDGNIDPESVSQRITSRTKAIIPVHLAGLPCEMNSLWRIARANGLFVIEDAAHAIGTHYECLPIGAAREDGTASDAVAFSFYATKNLTTGEGGMVTTHNEELLERMRILCLHGINKDAWTRYTDKGNWFYEVTEIGFKYNLSDLQSAIGIHQLRRQEAFIHQRARYAAIYREAFSDAAELEVPPDSVNGRHCWHLYLLRLRLDRLSIDRAEFIAELNRHGIGTSVHFIPIPLHRAYERLLSPQARNCPRALALYPRLISLPLYPAMTEDEVRRVARGVMEIVRAARQRRVLSTSGAGF